MNGNPYTVAMTNNNDQSSLFRTSFATLTAAQDFFNVLKRSVTAHSIDIELVDPCGKRIELVQLESKDGEAASRRYMTYAQLSKPIEPLTTGNPSFLLID